MKYITSFLAIFFFSLPAISKQVDYFNNTSIISHVVIDDHCPYKLGLSLQSDLSLMPVNVATSANYNDKYSIANFLIPKNNYQSQTINQLLNPLGYSDEHAFGTWFKPEKEITIGNHKYRLYGVVLETHGDTNTEWFKSTHVEMFVDDISKSVSGVCTLTNNAKAGQALY